jgi:3-deoxy-manno-octulosonate cytidylyltransferase (CMP-KDO synthetase)
MFKAVIPARHASSRLPGKPLLDIGGKPMVVRVAEQALQSQANEILVATDHPDIVSACQQHNIPVLLTRSDWPTGTDRLAEVVKHCNWPDDTVVVNVQGDEPLIDPQLINLVADTLLQSDQDIATCGHPIHTWADFTNPNIVKIALKENLEALYFSRAPIPFPRDYFSTQQWPSSAPTPHMGIRHIGLYAYRAHFLKRFQELPISAIETLESLEQLRALAHGFRIKVCMIQQTPHPGVDTPQDLERIRSLYAASHCQ